MELFAAGVIELTFLSYYIGHFKHQLDKLDSLYALTVILLGYVREVVLPEAVRRLTVSEPVVAVIVYLQVAQVVVVEWVPRNVAGDIRGWFPATEI